MMPRSGKDMKHCTTTSINMSVASKIGSEG